jgi:hypothetical protein
MRKLLAAALLAAFLPGCAIVGVGIAGITADNIAQGNSSYTNQALDKVCDRTSGQERLADGNCPPGK